MSREIPDASRRHRITQNATVEEPTPAPAPKGEYTAKFTEKTMPAVSPTVQEEKEKIKRQIVWARF